MKGIDFESVSGQLSRTVGLREGDSDGLKVGSMLGLSEAKLEGVMDGIDVGDDEDVGMDDGLSDTIGVGFDDGLLEFIAVGDTVEGETLVPSPPSVGIGCRLILEVGPDGLSDDGRSIGVAPDPSDWPGLFSYIPVLTPTFALTVVPVSLYAKNSICSQKPRAQNPTILKT